MPRPHLRPGKAECLRAGPACTSGSLKSQDDGDLWPGLRITTAKAILKEGEKRSKLLTVLFSAEASWMGLNLGLNHV